MDITNEPTFTPEVIAAILRNEGGSLAGMPSAARQYIRGRLRVPGAPEIQDLKVTDTRAIIGILSFSLESDKDWTGYTARVQENNDFEQNANNPFFPKWYSKTDDRPNPWMSDTGDIDGLNQKMIDQIFYMWQRPYYTGTKFIDIMKPAPVDDPMIMESVVDALKNFTGILLRPMGVDTGKNDEFRWCTTIPMLTSLGYDSFRSLSKFIAMHTDEADFQQFSTIDDIELTAVLKKAGETSGYPINIGHVDCSDMIQALERCKLVQAPRWLPSLVLLHVMKHVRYYENLNGKKFLFAAYRGRFAFIELPENGSFTPLGFASNKAVLSNLENILRIRGGTGRKRTPCELAVAGVLNIIQPEQITQPIAIHLRPDIIVAPRVTMRQVIPNQHERKCMWMDPGISVHNLGQFDAETGEINSIESVKNELAMSLAWPLTNKTRSDVSEWQFELPEKVTPMRPSQIIFGLVRNINPLGHLRGLQHVYDAIIIMDLIRHELIGTAIGGMANKEFPPMWTLPMGSSMEETTNQGKTNFSRVTARIMVPGIDTSSCSLSTSPPAQRSSASQIERHGTAFYDEFVMPKSPDHFLHTQGFVSLCTGGVVNPGKAMENSEGFRLSHPLFLAAKSGPEVPDVKNRSFMIFMDQITEQNKCSKPELAAIFSGKASIIARLSALLWIYKNDVVARIRELEPEFGSWRFNAHLAVIKLLAGDEYPEAEAYLEAMWKQCAAQRDDVDASNLMTDLGYKDKFDPKWYWDNAQDSTMDALYSQCKMKGPVRMLEVARILIEDSGGRRFSEELKSKYIAEKGAASSFTMSLKAHGPFKRGPFTMWIDKTRTDHRTVTTAAMVTKETAIEPVPIPRIPNV